MHSFRVMNKTVGIKICGMTRADDVDLALALGADYLGFIVYAGSPRGLSLEHAIELASRVPEQRRVVVDVESSADDLQRYRDAGFAHFQVHTNLPIDEADLASRADIISRERLWLAPRGGAYRWFSSKCVAVCQYDCAGYLFGRTSWGNRSHWRFRAFFLACRQNILGRSGSWLAVYRRRM